MDLKDLCLSPEDAISTAIASIDRNGKAIVLITDSERRLLGTISDGDIRRAILAGRDMQTPISELLALKRNTSYPTPVTALQGTDQDTLLRLMKEHTVRQIPIVDADGRVVDLVTWEDILPEQKPGLQAVIMAGGFGTRLRPLTENMPKPMLPVNGRPLMELIVEQLRDAGITNVNVTTHFQPEKIIKYFGDGHNFGVDLKYVTEDQPLGTGGALGLISLPTQPLLVINGDILTQVDFRTMLAYHQENKAMLTVAVAQYGIQVPYGVIESDGALVRKLVEKPKMNFFINAGIYLLEPAVYQFIPDGKHFNMTDLIQWLLDAGKTVVSFPIMEYWLDIGEHNDYKQAQKDVRDGKVGK